MTPEVCDIHDDTFPPPAVKLPSNPKHTSQWLRYVLCYAIHNTRRSYGWDERLDVGPKLSWGMFFVRRLEYKSNLSDEMAFMAYYKLKICEQVDLG